MRIVASTTVRMSTYGTGSADITYEPHFVPAHGLTFKEHQCRTFIDSVAKNH